MNKLIKDIEKILDNGAVIDVFFLDILVSKITYAIQNISNKGAISVSDAKAIRELVNVRELLTLLDIRERQPHKKALKLMQAYQENQNDC